MDVGRDPRRLCAIPNGCVCVCVCVCVGGGGGMMEPLTRPALLLQKGASCRVLTPCCCDAAPDEIWQNGTTQVPSARILVSWIVKQDKACPTPIGAFLYLS